MVRFIPIRDESTKIKWHKLLFGISTQFFAMWMRLLSLLFAFPFRKKILLDFVSSVYHIDTDQSWTKSEFKSSSFLPYDFVPSTHTYTQIHKRFGQVDLPTNRLLTYQI